QCYLDQQHVATLFAKNTVEPIAIVISHDARPPLCGKATRIHRLLLGKPPGGIEGQSHQKVRRRRRAPAFSFGLMLSLHARHTPFTEQISAGLRSVQVKQISSGANAICKSIRRLSRSSRARREEGRIVLDGIHLVQSYLERFAANEIELVIRASAMQHQEVKVLTERA